MVTECNSLINKILVSDIACNVCAYYAGSIAFVKLLDDAYCVRVGADIAVW